LRPVSKVNQNISEGTVNADVNCNSAVGSNLISDADLGARASTKVPSKVEAVPDPRQGTVEGAARELVSARLARRRLARLPTTYPPYDFEAALRTQRVVGALLQERIAGWKCALPSSGKMIVAPIYGSVIADGSRWRLPVAGHKARLEPEVALVLERDLPPRTRPYEAAEVREAVGSVRLALELLDCRYADPEQVSFTELLADGLFNAGLFLGPEVSGGLARQLGQIAITLEVDGTSAQRLDGSHPDGDPVPPLLWLANMLRERGEGLERGQVVITGSYAGVLEVPSSARLRIGFGELGSIAIQLSAED
jgi:2-keto-4-pentenoate hydratase